MNTAVVLQSLAVMGQGMLGVFAVMILLALSITLLNRFGRTKKKDGDKDW